MSRATSELSPIVNLAVPIVITQLGTMVMGLVDMWMVGKVGTSALAAVALGDTWAFGTLVLGQGLIQGMDPLVTQAHGAKDHQALGRSLQRGLLLALILIPVLTLIWQTAQTVLLQFGQDPELCLGAETYIQAQLFSIPALLGFLVLRQYLQGRGVVKPALWTVLIANIFNIGFNQIFIFGGWGIPALGIEGAGYATGASRWLMFVLLILFIIRGRHLAEGWVPWTLRSFSGRAMGVLLLLGLPISIHFGVEVWTFQAATLMAGQIGEIELAAHIIVLKIISFTFMFPLGIAGSATTRVGNLLGMGEVPQARKAAQTAICLGATVMAASGVVIWLMGIRLPGIFTTDAAVLASTLSLIPIAAGFQIFDGIQAVTAGVLRGAGKTIPAAVIGIIGFPLLTLPLAYHLTFKEELGLPGIWWAYLIGLVITAALLVGWFALTTHQWKPMQRKIAGE
ncbi:MAG: MATE family efflux transporter [Planctomycetota bacterium]